MRPSSTPSVPITLGCPVPSQSGRFQPRLDPTSVALTWQVSRLSFGRDWALAALAGLPNPQSTGISRVRSNVPAASSLVIQRGEEKSPGLSVRWLQTVLPCRGEIAPAGTAVLEGEISPGAFCSGGRRPGWIVSPTFKACSSCSNLAASLAAWPLTMVMMSPPKRNSSPAIAMEQVSPTLESGLLGLATRFDRFHHETVHQGQIEHIAEFLVNHFTDSPEPWTDNAPLVYQLWQDALDGVDGHRQSRYFRPQGRPQW